MIGGISAVEMVCPGSYEYHAYIIIAFAIIGFGLKYIDDAFDEEVFSKKIALLIAPILVIVAVILAIKDTASQTILFSILLSVLIGGKVDNLTFKLSAIAFLVLLFLTSLSLYGTIHFLWIPLVILTIIGVIDEKGNAYIDSNKTKEFTHFFFQHRFSMKIGMLLVCVLQFIAWRYLIAFLAFDMAYEFVRVFRYLDVPNFSSKVKKLQHALIILNKFK